MRTHSAEELDAYNEKVEALICEITAAFDGVSREGGLSLHAAAGLDDYEYSPEEQAANRAKDTETRWQEVPDEWIARMGLGDVALSYFDPNGFHYYIPAYLIWMLKSWRDGGIENNTEDSIIYSLMAQHDGSISEKDLARFSMLNGEQSKAVAHFLEFLVQPRTDVHDETSDGFQEIIDAIFCPPIQKAINSYWGQFL